MTIAVAVEAGERFAQFNNDPQPPREGKGPGREGKRPEPGTRSGGGYRRPSAR